VNESPLLAELRALEQELHHPGVRADHARLEALLHADFHEIGRSGTAYTRDTVIAHLLAGKERPAVESNGFGVAELAAGVALLTYRSAHRLPDGSLALRAHRSSIWQSQAGRWQLRYHQGTPAAGES
jgi:hypothetical protein